MLRPSRLALSFFGLGSALWMVGLAPTGLSLVAIAAVVQAMTSADWIAGDDRSSRDNESECHP